MGFDVKTRLSMLKSSAKARGIQVNLDINKYQLIIENGCEFCGDDLTNENGYCLDRVDPKKGYTLMNVVACCKICNRAKSNMEVHDFLNWIEKTSEHLKKKINQAKELKSLGLTQEMYDILSNELFNELTKDTPKIRIKYVPPSK